MNIGQKMCVYSKCTTVKMVILGLHCRAIKSKKVRKFLIILKRK